MDALRDEHLKALSNGDLEAYLDVFTKGVVFMAPDGPQVNGRAAVADYSRPFFSAFNTRQTQDPAEVVIQDDIAIEHGTLTVTMQPKTGGGLMAVSGSYLFVARPQLDRTWRYSEMIWNNDRAGAVRTSQESVRTPIAKPGATPITRIQFLLQRIAAAINAGDASALVREFTADAVCMPPGMKALTGSSILSAECERVFANADINVRIRSSNTSVHGAWAIDRGSMIGRVRERSGGKSDPIDYKYLMVLRREGSSVWRVARVLWNWDR